ncbi:MAG: hypothetical protein ACI8O8_001653 [Oleiphilaceae bacterium]|jgi:hypothetical protein
MYAVASARIGLVAELPTMIWIAQIIIILALLVWCLSMSGMLQKLNTVYLNNKN